MKTFEVDVDITMSCRIEVDAESEEQAKTIVGNWIGDSPWQYVREGLYKPRVRGRQRERAGQFDTWKSRPLYT